MPSLDSEDVRFLLWFALGLAVTSLILSDCSTLSALLLILVFLAQALSLVAYPQDLRKKYEVVATRMYGCSVRTGLLNNFKLWMFLLAFMLFGCFLIWDAYSLAQHFSPPKKFLLREVYVIFGANSYILFTASLGTYAVGVGIEILIGSHVEKK
jgi:hypothetical protein